MIIFLIFCFIIFSFIWYFYFFSIFYISFIPSNHKLIILFSQIRHYYVNNQNLNIK